MLLSKFRKIPITGPGYPELHIKNQISSWHAKPFQYISVMTTARIQTLTERIAVRENKNKDPVKHPNRFTSQSVQLKKRLEILWARLSNPAYQSTTYRYTNPIDPWTLIVSDYDKILTDIYNNILYLITLDQYTYLYTHNRGYYCRKKNQIHDYLISEYTEIPTQLYTMWDEAWERFFANPRTRLPLNNHLFNYLMKLQDEQKEKGSVSFHSF